MIFVALTAFGVQAFYWVALWRGFRRSGATDGKPPSPMPMSVIVAARNEAPSLPALLRALQRQDHPAYEVVIVDDGSTDASSTILAGTTMENLRVVTTGGIGKKGALTKGIEAASYSHLAFTDADCSPPPGWLSALAGAHAGCDSDCVLVGYSPFEHSGGLAQRLAAYETFVTGFLTAAAAGLNRPYMAVGRNISYPRSAFERAGGFGSIMHSLSGDDDLFVQAVSRRSAARVRAVLDPRTFVPTPAPRTFREWLRQKRRHTSAGRYYLASVKAHLAAFHTANLIVWLAPVFFGWPGAVLLAGKLALKFVVLRDAAVRLRETDLIPLQPVLEPLYLLYNLLIAPLGLIKMPRRW